MASGSPCQHISGYVVCKSNFFHFKTGLTGCLQVRTVEYDDIYIALSSPHLEHFTSIEVSARYCFIGICPCYMESKQRNNSSNNAPIWYTSMNNLIVAKLDIPQLESYHLMNVPLLEQLLHEYYDITNNSDYFCDNYVIQPLSVEERLVMAYSEVNIQFMVSNLFSEGWIEMYPQRCKLFVYLTFYTLNDAKLSQLRKGSVVKMRNVMPLFFDKSLRGFAMTTRSSIVSIDNESLATVSNNAVSFKIPPLLKNCCLYFSLWFHLVKQQFYYHLASMSGFDSYIEHFIDNHSDSYKLCAISKRSVLKEFSDKRLIEFNLYRAQLDSDYLDSLLPKVYALSAINGIVKELSDNSQLASVTAMDEYIDNCQFYHIIAEVSSIQVCCIHLHKSSAVLNCSTPTGESLQIFVTGPKAMIESKFLPTSVSPILVVCTKLVVVKERIGVDNSMIYYYSRAEDIQMIASKTLKRSLTETEDVLSSTLTSHCSDSIASNCPIYLGIPSSARVTLSNPICIRQALMMKFTKDIKIFQLVGVVILKSYLSDKLTSNYEKYTLLVVLRDPNFPDTLKVYLPYSYATKLIIGSTVVIHNCVIIKSDNKSVLHVYGKIKEDYPLRSSVGILSFADCSNDLQHWIALDSVRLSYEHFKPILDLGKLMLPPFSHLCSMEADVINDTNFALWTVSISVVAIKRLTLQLHCTNCNYYYNRSSRADNNRIKLSCQRCTNPIMKIKWEGLVCIDDYTNVALMNVSQSLLLSMLKCLCPSSHFKHFYEFISDMEQVVQLCGFVALDTFFFTRSALKNGTVVSTGDDAEEEFFNIEDYSTKYETFSRRLAELFIQRYCRNRFDVTLKLVHLKKSLNAAMKMKDMTVQEYRQESSRRVSTISIPTKFPEGICLDCLDFKHISGDVIDIKSYKQQQHHDSMQQQQLHSPLAENNTDTQSPNSSP